MGARILIVEDEPAIAENTLYALSTDGHTAIWSETGQQALQQLAEAKFDLILLDVGLPDMNGFELFKQVSSKWALPIVFLTARTEEIDRVVGLELGADDYIAKPFSPRELCARVRVILKRTQTNILTEHAPQNATITTSKHSHFSVNDDKKTIHFHQQLLQLSRTEYFLLKTLIARPGKVFTREELMQQAWEHPEVSIDRTVDTHVKLLRQKLKQIAPASEVIITHRGLGYALSEE